MDSNIGEGWGGVVAKRMGIFCVSSNGTTTMNDDGLRARETRERDARTTHGAMAFGGSFGGFGAPTPTQPPPSPFGGGGAFGAGANGAGAGAFGPQAPSGGAFGAPSSSGGFGQAAPGGGFGQAAVGGGFGQQTPQAGLGAGSPGGGAWRLRTSHRDVR